MIRFLLLEGKSCSEINERLDSLYRDSAPAMASAKKWFKEMQPGRITVFDKPCPGVLKTASTLQRGKNPGSRIDRLPIEGSRDS